MQIRYLHVVFILLFFVGSVNLVGQEHEDGHGHGMPATSHQDEGHQGDSDEHSEDSHSCGGHHGDHHGEFDPGGTAFHHISDQHIYSIGPWHIPLPCIFYTPGHGIDFFSSSVFNADLHGTGTKANNRFVLFEGSARRITDDSFPMGVVDIGEHSLFFDEVEENGEKKEYVFLCYEDHKYKCDNKSTIDGGLFGGGITSFHDFSITKNVASMLLVTFLLGWMFLHIARAYEKRRNMAPSGIQSFIEPIFVFIQDDVAKPFLGHKWEKFQPLLMALFFFILGLNLFGQVPFLGGSNVTGNLSVTLTLAVIAFIVTNINGNKHYWGHIFNMPGIPAWVKVIVTPVEIMGLFIKPITLMLRLFGNITAGHMVIVIFVGLIFIFGESGANPGAAWGTAVGSILLTMFMMAIELLVAFIQAFVFAILTASYIGAAIEEHHDH
jgi:F-type H+-transporting ATPase subunit a